MSDEAIEREIADGRLTVTVSRKKGKGADYEEDPTMAEVETVKAPEEAKATRAPFATVKFAAGATISLGKFEFARVDVGVEIPVRFTPDGLNKGFDFAYNFVGDKLEEAISKIDKGGK